VQAQRLGGQNEDNGMKKQHWNTLVTSIRHGQCILVLGPEIRMGTVGTPADTADSSFAEALTRELAAELEEDELRVTGTTLAAVAQQYEDAQDFGPNALRARPPDCLLAVSRLCRRS
jgi:hypothetical protein